MKVISFVLLFISCVAIGGARAELLQFPVVDGHVADAGFPVSFPQLYFFNANRKLFYVTGGGAGDAVSDLKIFAKGLDKKKLQRMANRAPIGRHADWARRFSQLDKLLGTPDGALFSNAASVTLIGFILDPVDYPHCSPCKMLEEDMRKLSQNDSLSVILIKQKRQLGE